MLVAEYAHPNEDSFYLREALVREDFVKELHDYSSPSINSLLIHASCYVMHTAYHIPLPTPTPYIHKYLCTPDPLDVCASKTTKVIPPPLKTFLVEPLLLLFACGYSMCTHTHTVHSNDVL